MLKNGDAYELIKEIPSKSVDLIITDPPYNIGTGGYCGVFKNRGKEHYTRQLEAKNLLKGYDLSILDEFVRILKRIYIYMVQ